DLAAWRETHSYIRTPQQVAEQGDGFTLAQLFGPMRPARRRFMELALAPSTMRALRHLGYPRLLAGQLAAIARDTPVISILSLPAENPAASDLLRAGAYLTDYWLRATHSGLAMHPLSILLQHEEARRDLRRRPGARCEQGPSLGTQKIIASCTEKALHRAMIGVRLAIWTTRNAGAFAQVEDHPPWSRGLLPARRCWTPQPR